MDISIHDNSLLSYSISADKREIRPHAAFPDDERPEYTDVVFSGVVAYHSEHDKGILFDIRDKYEPLFSQGRNYHWPVGHDSKESPLRRMREQEIRAFVILSSDGISGWIRT
jgi:hypothetical protein